MKTLRGLELWRIKWKSWWYLRPYGRLILRASHAAFRAGCSVPSGPSSTISSLRFTKAPMAKAFANESRPASPIWFLPRPRYSSCGRAPMARASQRALRPASPILLAPRSSLSSFGRAPLAMICASTVLSAASIFLSDHIISADPLSLQQVVPTFVHRTCALACTSCSFSNSPCTAAYTAWQVFAKAMSSNGRSGSASVRASTLSASPGKPSSGGVAAAIR
mmetsp:Transcript_48517/g.80573  ORF Transcript_48517/g.80573 Transcript_48517/m.80573 type:complete len:221 (-) Transcript_48517:38-700(-)